MKIKLTTTLIVAIAAATMLGAGCKKQAPQSTGIYQSYTVRYIPGENKTLANAYFRYTDYYGKQVIFADKNEVTVNGDPSLPSPTSGGEQIFSWNIDGMQDVVFSMPGLNDGTLNNKANRTMMGDLELQIDSVLYVSDSMHASWSGTPLLPKGETINVSLSWVSDSTGTFSGMSDDFFGPNSDGYSCTFDYKESSKLIPGKYIATLVKSRNIHLQQPDGISGGAIQVMLTVSKTVVVK